MKHSFLKLLCWSCGVFVAGLLSQHNHVWADPVPTPAPAPGNTPPKKLWWRIETQKDKLDGRSIISAQKNSFETIIYPQREKPVFSKTATMNVICDKGKTIVYFTVESTLIAGHRTSFSYRLDDKLPVKGRAWEASTDYTSVGTWDGRASISFIKNAMTANKIFIRVEHNVFGRTEADFDLTELKEAMIPIREACKW